MESGAFLMLEVVAQCFEVFFVCVCVMKNVFLFL